MITLNTLLKAAGIEPETVTVLLHKTNLQPFRKMLPSIVEEHPSLFSAYQSVHSSTAERTLANRPYVASFVPLDDDEMVFSGLFRIASQEMRTFQQIYSDPRYKTLEDVYGASDTGPTRHLCNQGSQLFFELDAQKELSELIGRLVIATPTGRAYARLASNLAADVVTVLRNRQTLQPAPQWNMMIVAGRLVGSLPNSWKNALRHWRGIYLIVDELDGARYVGSAYGKDNLLGRWQNHVAGSKGITKELSKRVPENFRFSILQLLAPDAEPAEVIALEHSWMNRLHTREYGLNA